MEKNISAKANTSEKKVSAEVPKPKPPIKKPPNGAAWARNAGVHVSMAGQGTREVSATPPRRLQYAGCGPPNPVWGRQLPLRILPDKAM